MHMDSLATTQTGAVVGSFFSFNFEHAHLMLGKDMLMESSRPLAF